MDGTLTNWAGNVTYSATDVHRPTSVDEVAAIVGAASSAGQRIHAVGTRHSFSRVADTAPGGFLVDTTGLDRVLGIDPVRRIVAVEGGIRYGELSAALHAAGHALHNLPSLPHITVAGAVATATHGSGVGNGNLATAVRAIELVTADGSLVRIDESDARFPGAVVGLGALGIVVRLDLEIEPTFTVAQTVYRDLPFAGGGARLAEVLASAYSVSLFTTYQREGFEQVWWKGRVDRDGDAPAELAGARPAETRVHPVAGVPADSCTEQLGRPGPWADRLPHFRLGFVPSTGDELQSEYFVPREAGAAAVDAVRSLREALAGLLQISEIRTVAADGLWASPAHGRDTVAIHFTWVADEPGVMAFLPRLEAALAPFGARPHWGKLTAMPAEVVRATYPAWGDLVRLADRLDPAGTFRNPYVDALFD